eukprot:1136136-Pelagomonas_calceolata.AAC.10
MKATDLASGGAPDVLLCMRCDRAFGNQIRCNGCMCYYGFANMAPFAVIDVQPMSRVHHRALVFVALSITPYQPAHNKLGTEGAIV